MRNATYSNYENPSQNGFFTVFSCSLLWLRPGTWHWSLLRIFTHQLKDFLLQHGDGETSTLNIDIELFAPGRWDVQHHCALFARRPDSNRKRPVADEDGENMDSWSWKKSESDRPIQFSFTSTCLPEKGFSLNFHSFSIHFVLLEMFGAELQGLRREHQRWEGPPAKQPHVTIGFRKGQHKPYLDGVEVLKPRHDCTSNSYIVHI